MQMQMQILKDLWTDENDTTETRNTYQYILELKEKLEKTCKLARESLHEAQRVYKHHYDKKTRPRSSRLAPRCYCCYLQTRINCYYNGEVRTKL